MARNRTKLTAEETRLEESHNRKAHWKRWGPYVSERAWGTVREDYSTYGSAWDYLPHDHARSRAYRWNEDGIAGISDRDQKVCFALALWNGRDPILKERMFGLTGNEGNHGEDVKEYYFYVDSTPTHSYMKYLYKYPQQEFPYRQLIDENRNRGKQASEFELIDTGVFDEDRYFDVVVEYAKADVEDILIRITATNHGPETASLNLLPTIWFRNTWSWDQEVTKPNLKLVTTVGVETAIELNEPELGRRWFQYEGTPELLFTENETNTQLLFNSPNASPHVKDGINNYVVNGVHEAVNPNLEGTKATANYSLRIESGQSATVRLRLSTAPQGFAEFDEVFAKRSEEADEFYATVIPTELSDDAKLVMRQSKSSVGITVA